MPPEVGTPDTADELGLAVAVSSPTPILASPRTAELDPGRDLRGPALACRYFLTILCMRALRAALSSGLQFSEGEEGLEPLLDELIDTLRLPAAEVDITALCPVG